MSTDVDKLRTRLLSQLVDVRAEMKVLKNRAGSMSREEKIDFETYTHESDRLLALKVSLSDQLNDLDNGK